jgi:caffeoyl-CoA O-methyltransferase
MEFIDEKLLNYAEEHTSPESAILNCVNRETHLEVLQPRMLSGHLQGRFLSLISNLVNPQFILEIGTYTGYSALCLAEGLSENGRLLTIDINEELASRVRTYFDESGFGEKIEMLIGDACELIPAISEQIDLVFIDADKENYCTYLDLVVPKMKKGGLIIADNVLWSGKVIQEVKNTDHSTKAILAFNALVQKDDRLENVLLPVRDGLMMARVK